ncbi:uncharacterized protein LAESUDRAFT_754917 [Laetiporus sulphureus 93-53]|uniref:MARVEL domain-containing protein n=1 Tax=Laetiporus sulphureus 93-53 TaxID=1314785 RepID=A0A165H4Z5_9APHY|nr:uncharacterized protein LAESUDRAFT_754917 [Laetiporus sulphureus 93-53]KZT11251.1 hypothetical protein LAESUDRAFT_754917 [Laetiporus sulphureus 93-53]
MRNPAVLLRFIIFFFLLYVNVLAMGFAAWNLSAVKSAQLDVEGPAIFVIFNSCCILLYTALCFIELFYPSFGSPKIMLECVAIAAFGMLQFAAAVDATVSGPPVVCSGSGNVNPCASSSVLVAVTWISASTVLMYLFAFIGIVAMHARVQGAIWGCTVTSVAWFGLQRSPYGNSDFKDAERNFYELKDDEVRRAVSSVFGHDPFTDQAEKGATVVRGLTISAPQSKSVESFRPQWAKDVEPRRGVDPPFCSPPPKSPGVVQKVKSYWSATTASIYGAPPLPPKARTIASRGYPRRSVGSELSLPMIASTPSRPISYGIFPEDVADPDVPIQTHRRTEWIRAQDAHASSIHTGYAR